MVKGIRLGFHLSMHGGASSAALEAAENGYLSFQTFVTNPRTWRLTEVGADDARSFNEIVRKNDLMPFAHMTYLCNPSSPKEEVLSKSIEALKGNMRNCSALGIRQLVVHTGSHLGRGMEKAMESVDTALHDALSSAGVVELLLENSSGYRNSTGSDFRDIGAMVDMIGSKRVGVCLDTCHAYAYGYDISTRKGTSLLMDSIEEHVGLERVKLIHLNDSRYALGSRMDRHWNIGKGYIGVKGFAEFFKASRLGTESFVMETPVSSERERESDMRAAEKAIKLAGIR